MSGITVTCPRCGRRLTMSDAAPMQLTCPRCLESFQRPAASESTGPPAVLPVDGQVTTDTRLSNGALRSIGALIAFGLFVIFMRMGQIFVGLIAAILVMVGSIAVSIAGRARREPPPRATILSGAMIAPPEGSKVLDYERPRPGSGPGHPGATLGAFFCGFLFAIAVCAGCFFLLAATASSARSAAPSYRGAYLLLVLIAIVGTCIGGGMIGARWPGFGAGVATGMGLGMIALAPCGICYMLAL